MNNAGYTFRPVKYKHSNPNKSVVDAFDYTVGAKVDNIVDLYDIPPEKINLGGLVYVVENDELYKLIDKSKIGSSDGWEIFSIDLSDYYTKLEIVDLLKNKVDKVNGKGLSENDLTNSLYNKLLEIESSKFLGQFTSLTELKKNYPSPIVGSYAYVDKGVGETTVKYLWDSTDSTYIKQQGEIAEETPASILSKFLQNPDAEFFTTAYKTQLDNLVSDLAGKVDKETGKGLSSNDFSNTLKEKLEQQRETILISGNKFTYIPIVGNDGETVVKGDIAKDGWVNQNTFGKLLVYTGTGDATLIENWKIIESI